MKSPYLKYFYCISIAFLVCCTKANNPNNFTFIKLGDPETEGESYPFGTKWYLSYDNNVDSVILKITSADLEQNNMPVFSRIYKIKVPASLKNTIDNFITHYSLTPNGQIEDKSWQLRNAATYNGGDYVVFFNDYDGDLHYYFFIPNEYFYTAFKLWDEVFNLVLNENEYRNLIYDIEINSDSIISSLIEKTNLKDIIPQPIKKVEPPLIK